MKKIGVFIVILSLLATVVAIVGGTKHVRPKVTKKVKKV